MHKLVNAFNQVNRIRCFNHTMQLSVKALLRPFASTAGTADTNNDIAEDNSMPVDDEPPSLEDVEDDINEDDGEEDIVDDDDGGAQVNDDDDKVEDGEDGENEEELKALMDNTASVRSTLDKVFFLPLSFGMNTDILLIRYVNSPLRLFTQQPLSFLPGVELAPPTLTRFASFLVMSRRAGIQHTICLRLLQTIALSLMTSQLTRHSNFVAMNLMIRSGRLLRIFYEF
jgi:hypothetical protein